MSLNFLKHPLVVLVSLVVAVVSIGLSAYFYISSREFREPVYLVEEEHKQIFDSTASSPKIKVLDKDSNPVTDNIFLVTVTLWNAGTISIEPEDVRIPVKIQIKPIAKLLDYSIVKEIDPEVAKFHLTESLGLSWTYFDPGYGVKVQLLYSAPEQANIKVTGKIKGVAEIKQLSSATRFTNIVQATELPLVMVLAVFFGFNSRRITRTLSRGNERLKLPVEALTLGVFIILIMIISRFSNLVNTFDPPL